MPASPAFSSMEELRTIYDELSSKPCPYYKSVVRIKLSKRSFVTRTIIHSGAHADLKPESHRGAVGVELIGRHTEMTTGLLYLPQVSSQNIKMSTEWLLIFKIDCDLSRKKTGSVDSALAHYIAPSTSLYRAAHIRRLRHKLDRGGMGGRPLGEASKPVGDLLIRYGKKRSDGTWDTEDFSTAWILQNRYQLEHGGFMGEEYREPTLVRSTFGLDEVERVDEDTIRIDFGLNILGDG
jgi:hypothetical protein